MRTPRKLKKKNKKIGVKWTKDCIEYAIKNGFKKKQVNYDIVFNTKPEFKDLRKYYGN